MHQSMHSLFICDDTDPHTCANSYVYKAFFDVMVA
jgi:hypothetical protein